MARFAELRSASRALPAVGSDVSGAAGREERASKLREGLAELGKREASSDDLVQVLDRATAEIGVQLDVLERDLLDRFDGLDFVSLRASVPQSVESHSHEVLALLEVLLARRDELLARLPRVEYLITMLSTVEVDGRRNIVRDPAALTPTLENFTVASLDSQQAEAFAMELYQAATLDSDSENFHPTLRALREQKQSVGLGCLCPNVLRAVVTYNARMFNSVEALSALSRASDAVVDEAFAISADHAVDQLDSLDSDGVAVDLEEPEQGTPDEETDQGSVSVFDSTALGCVIEALRRRLDGEQVGTDSPERVALVLDQSLLDPLEITAIRAMSPDAEQNVLARTAVVGLMLRDFGSIASESLPLGIAFDQLSDAWVRELSQAFARLISEKLADPRAYELTSKLSSIKSKHLLKPFNALKAGNREASSNLSGIDERKPQTNRSPQAATGGASPKERRRESQAGRRQGDAPGTRSGGAGGRRRADAATQGFSFTLGESRLKLTAAAALVITALGLVVSNMIGVSPDSIEILGPRSLSQTSPYLQSAYRNEEGRGGLLVGRVEVQFEALLLEEKIKAAEEMVLNFESQGIREAMLYDSRGMMQVHYAGGRLHRPRPGSRATGRRAGEAAARRSLTGQVIDMEQVPKNDDDDWDSWGDS
jgi:hypothetical protein